AVVRDSMSRLSKGVGLKCENVLLAGFGTQVGSPRIANKSKQGIGRRIVVVQAEVKSTSNHFNKGESLIASNVRNSGEKKTRHIPGNNNLRRRTKKQEHKDYIYTHRQQIT